VRNAALPPCRSTGAFMPSGCSPRFGRWNHHGIGPRAALLHQRARTAIVPDETLTASGRKRLAHIATVPVGAAPSPRLGVRTITASGRGRPSYNSAPSPRFGRWNHHGIGPRAALLQRRACTAIVADETITASGRGRPSYNRAPSPRFGRPNLHGIGPRAALLQQRARTAIVADAAITASGRGRPSYNRADPVGAAPSPRLGVRTITASGRGRPSCNSAPSPRFGHPNHHGIAPKAPFLQSTTHVSPFTRHVSRQPEVHP